MTAYCYRAFFISLESHYRLVCLLLYDVVAVGKPALYEIELVGSYGVMLQVAPIHVNGIVGSQLVVLNTSLINDDVAIQVPSHMEQLLVGFHVGESEEEECQQDE